MVAVVDSNSEPDSVTYPVPGNDDASRAINLYCDLMVGAVLDGIQAEMAASGTDLGALEELPEEPAPRPATVAEEAPAAETAMAKRSRSCRPRRAAVRGCRRDRLRSTDRARSACPSDPARHGPQHDVGMNESWLQ